jgi:hypothetical protein
MNDYFVVMAYVNHYCLDTFACLELDAKPSHVNQLNLAN